MIVATSLVATTPAAADSGWRDAEPGTGDGAGLRACMAQAQQERPSAWFCLGGELTTTAQDPAGKVDVTTRTIIDDYRDTTSPVGPLADDYDSWCENGSICGRRPITHPRAHVARPDGRKEREHGCLAQESPAFGDKRAYLGERVRRQVDARAVAR